MAGYGGAVSGSGIVVLRLSAFEHAEQGGGDDTCATADAQHTAWELPATSQVVPLPCSAPFGVRPGPFLPGALVEMQEKE